MTKEEAIETIKKVLPMSKTLEDAFYTLHPELCESEDERIRKELVDFIQWAEEKGMTRHDYHQAKRPAVWIAYLEKQKEMDKCPEYCVRSHCIGCQIYEKRKEQTEEDVALFNKAVTTNKELTPTERTQLDIIRRVVNCSGIVQKEQKELPLMGGDANSYFDEWNLQHQNPTKRQCFEEGMKYSERLKKEQKPAEWCGGYNGSDNEEFNKAFSYFQAATYSIYREMLHFRTVYKGIDNVYQSPTLRCEGVDIPKITIEEEKK